MTVQKNNYTLLSLDKRVEKKKLKIKIKIIDIGVTTESTRDFDIQQWSLNGGQDFLTIETIKHIAHF